jgi:transcriptional regulator with XRE-family HTH domain
MEDTTTPSPVVQRLRLRQELRRARLDAELTQEEVAGVMDWSLSKLVRIENGSNSISTNDLKALLRYYRVSDETRVADLLALSRAARKRSGAGGQGSVARPLSLFMEYEKAAFSTSSFEPLVVPGMLQTPDYMRASTRELAPDMPEAEVEAEVGIRLGRQELLEAVRPPLMYFVMDEPVVRRVIGGPDVMRDQLRRLIAIGDMPNVTIEVVPYSAGLRPGMQEPFVMHQLSDSPDDYVLYIESPRGDQILTEDRDARYRRLFDCLRESSLGAQGSTVFLRELVDELS